MGGKHSSQDPMKIEVPKLHVMLDRDGYLKPYEKEYRHRWAFIWSQTIYSSLDRPIMSFQLQKTM